MVAVRLSFERGVRRRSNLCQHGSTVCVIILMNILRHYATQLNVQYRCTCITMIKVWTCFRCLGIKPSCYGFVGGLTTGSALVYG